MATVEFDRLVKRYGTVPVVHGIDRDGGWCTVHTQGDGSRVRRRHDAASLGIRSGSERRRVPVSVYTALATAGAIGGSPGSPIPDGTSRLGTMCVSITGHSSMRSRR